MFHSNRLGTLDTVSLAVRYFICKICVCTCVWGGERKGGREGEKDFIILFYSCVLNDLFQQND